MKFKIDVIGSYGTDCVLNVNAAMMESKMYRPFVNYEFWNDLNSCWRKNKGTHPDFSAFQAAAFKKGLLLSGTGEADLGAELSLRNQYVKPKNKSLILLVDTADKKTVEGYAKASSAPVDEVAAMLAKIGMEAYP